MKKIIQTVFALCALLVVGQEASAQTPEGFTYQAVARNSSGDLIKNQSITVKTVILSGPGASNKLYEERHVVTTNDFGHFNVIVGKGSTSDNFATIDWSSTTHHLKVELDQGSGFAVMGTVQLQSVPYALHSKTAESAKSVENLKLGTNDLSDVNSSTASNGDVLKWNGTSWEPASDNEGSDNTIDGKNVTASNPSLNDVLKWNGTAWTAGKDENTVTSYNAGTGIDVSGSTISAKSGDALWNANKLNGYNLPSGTPTNNQILRFNGTSWDYVTPSTSGGSGSSSGFWDSTNNVVHYNKGGSVVINNNRRLNNTRMTVWDSITASTTGNHYGFESIVFGGTSSAAAYTASRSFSQGRGGAESYGAVNVSTGDIHTNGNSLGTFSIASGDGRTTAALYGLASNANTFNLGVYADAVSASTAAAGTNYGIFAVADSGAVDYAGYFAGDVTYTGTLSGPSDAKLKYNVNDLNSATDIVKKLNAKTYYYKQEGDAALMNLPTSLQYGFIAQELETVLPTLVNDQVQMKGLKDMDQIEYKAVNYIGLIPVLTQALKEQQEQIEKLEKRLAELEANSKE
ncbi:MAG: tail fiber domain-containing protein [Bacteroidia bacterium]|nr:tail fiber domain-containing protein [Bacteroidia bacterium]